MEHSRCFTNTDFLPPSMNVAFTNEVWWIKNSLFFADRLYMIALFWTSICSKELSEVTSSHELITLTILSHHSFLCIYLRAYEDHFHITISTMSADKSATCLQLLFCLKNQQFSKFYLKMFLWVIAVKFWTNVRYHQISQVWNNWLRKKGAYLKFLLVSDSLTWLGRYTGCFVLLLIVDYTNTILFSLQKRNKSKIPFYLYSPLITTIINLVCILPDNLSMDLHIYYRA